VIAMMYDHTHLLTRDARRNEVIRDLRARVSLFDRLLMSMRIMRTIRVHDPARVRYINRHVTRVY